MSWNNSLYTNVGTKMMSEVLSGATMTITKAVGGSGTTAAESLAALTDVKEQKQTLKILGIEDATDSSDDDVGKRIKIQITNGDLETGYILHQVGIYAKLADGEETLLIIMQDDRGVEIPSHTENSDFSIELYGIMAISNLANISVTVDPNAVASVKMVNQQIAQVNTKIDKTKEDLQKEAQETYLSLSGGTLTGPLVMPGGGEVVSIMDNAATHNMVYRGKALGTSVTSEQWAAIKAGAFKDLYLGDYADMRNFIHSGFSISPVLEDDIDELRDERAAVVKAIQDAGLMRYEVCILPKPENTSSYCAAFYKITATSQNQAFEHGKETFIRGFANCGVTAENFDAEYDIGVTRGEKIE